MKKNDVWIAVGWIVAYCVIFGTVRGSYGDGSPVSAGSLAVFALVLTVYAAAGRQWGRLGLNRMPSNGRQLLYFLPMWVLATGNLWGGISRSLSTEQLFAVCTMLLVGYVEEFIFRGLLFTALLREGRAGNAILISALTFGMGHIINLFTGHGGLETATQIVFAVMWGLMFTLAFYKGGSLIPCVIIHSLIDVFSVVNSGVDSPVSWVHRGAVVLLGGAYCLYMAKIPGNKLT